ncbi:hypothetical protein [Mycolicibacterium fortuitum]|nr:hypothetical protein [Mycolicibacterium fortuitum]UBV14824.1 hypothetical protein H8Z57_29705 [Mycolicibacterium fortuitum]
MTTTTAMTWKYDSEMSRAYWADTELYTFRIRWDRADVVMTVLETQIEAI